MLIPSMLILVPINITSFSILKWPNLKHYLNSLLWKELRNSKYLFILQDQNKGRICYFHSLRKITNDVTSTTQAYYGESSFISPNVLKQMFFPPVVKGNKHKNTKQVSGNIVFSNKLIKSSSVLFVFTGSYLI